MSTKKKSRIPAEKVELYEKLLATIPEIERKAFTPLGNGDSGVLSFGQHQSINLAFGAR